MKKVFILDDNEELLEIMQRLLRKEFEVHCSADTDNVVPEIVAFDPDILILDHSIGETSSADILQKLKINNPSFSTPVVLFSAHHNLSAMAKSVGATGYIDKPSDIAHIRTYIKNILG